MINIRGEVPVETVVLIVQPPYKILYNVVEHVHDPMITGNWFVHDYPVPGM
jgi:hypothetical protein